MRARLTHGFIGAVVCAFVGFIAGAEGGVDPMLAGAIGAAIGAAIGLLDQLRTNMVPK